LSGDRVDERSDIWAAGTVLYEMVTGRRAFPETQASRLIASILHEAPTPPRALNSKVSPGLEAVISKALDKDADRRYQSAREMCVDLVRLTSTSEAVITPSAYLSSRGIKSRIIAAIVSLAIVLCIGIITGLFIRDRAARSNVKQRVLAVLPFEAVGQDARTDALGIGLTETVAAKLSQLGDMHALQLVPIREIAAQGIKTSDQARREFGTDLVIEGSLEQSGRFLRINCSLVDSRTQRQLGARTITTATDNIFDVQDRVVAEVLDILAIETRPDKHGPNTAPAAYEHYLRGRGFLQEYHKPENIEHAIAEFNQALQIDQKFALAYASLAQAYVDQANQNNDWVGKALTNCQKALSLAPDLSEAHSCLGNVYNGTGKYGESIEQFERALELDRSNEDALLGLPEAYEKLGNNSAAEATLQRAVALRPHYWGVYSALGAFYYRQARYADAADMFRQVIVVAPDNYKGYSNLGGVYVLQGKYSESITALQRSIDLRPNMDAYSNLGTAYFALRRFAEAADSYKQGLHLDEHDWLSWGNLGDALYWIPMNRQESQNAYRTAISLAQSKLEVNSKDATILAFVGTYYAMLDQKELAMENLHRALALAPADADVRFRAAIIYNHFGDTDQSLSWLEKASAAGFSLATIRDTPDFDHLQHNPRFHALIAGAVSKQ
jgi:tetratricopeptide (TPR) repeat protein